MDSKKIGQFIAKLRKEKGLTQKQLGNKLYVTDKAISKWERGLNLPDIILLQKLANEFDIEVSDILNAQIGSNKKENIKKELEILKSQIENNNKLKTKKMIFCIVCLLCITMIVILQNISFGYSIKKVEYSHSNRNINLGVPKTSFMMKHNDKSYSYKNLRNSNVIKNELKEYLKTLKYLTCNDTLYYYNEKDDFSITEYSVKNNILFRTISYQIDSGDYCFNKKIDEYADKLCGLKRFHTLNGGTIDKNADKIPKIEVFFLDDIDTSDNKYIFNASMQVISINRNKNNEFNNFILEESTGEFEIRDNKLYYYRKEIKENSKEIKIPEISVFKIENEKLILIDNYLSKYEKNIILK